MKNIRLDKGCRMGMFTAAGMEKWKCKTYVTLEQYFSFAAHEKVLQLCLKFQVH